MALFGFANASATFDGRRLPEVPGWTVGAAAAMIASATGITGVALMRTPEPSWTSRSDDEKSADL